MKVLEVNSFSNGSTGKIALGYYKQYKSNGDECYFAYARGPEPDIDNKYRITNKYGVLFHALLSRLFGRNGLYSSHSTKKFLKWIDAYKPDLIHLHNVHGYYLNYKLFFQYLVEKGYKVEWTLHDCWSFTGHCCYFTYANCNKWKEGCNNCPQLNVYPKSFFDNVEKNYKLKRTLFTAFDKEKLHLITPSAWLKNLVSESFLKKYEIKVKYNEIDLSVFKRINTDLKSKLNLDNKKIILGVSFAWDYRKGLDDFVKLKDSLQEDEIIILIGLTKKQIKRIECDKIMCIERTANQNELVEYYNIADCFVNFTREDNYPTVNLEAQACGTKVLTYDVGGCLETDMGKLKKISSYLDVLKEIRGQND